MFRIVNTRKLKYWLGLYWLPLYGQNSSKYLILCSAKYYTGLEQYEGEYNYFYITLYNYFFITVQWCVSMENAWYLHHFLSPNHLAWCHCFWCQPSGFGVYLYNGVTAGHIKAEGCECAGGQCSVFAGLCDSLLTQALPSICSPSPPSVFHWPQQQQQKNWTFTFSKSSSFSFSPSLASLYLFEQCLRLGVIATSSVCLPLQD